MPVQASASGPSREAIQSWDRYAAALERARAADLARGVPSWATDDDPGGTGVLTAVRRGEIRVSRRELRDVAVDDATLEHWQGSVLVRGVSIEQIAHRLRHPEQFPQPRDVLSLKVSHWQEGGHELFLRLTRSLLVTATYDTWYRVSHRVVSACVSTAWPCRPASTIAARVPGRGFLWRMQSAWRFTVVPQGVVVTCESITLSRPVPFGLGLVSRPIITRVARESMSTAVRAWQVGGRRQARRSLPGPAGSRLQAAGRFLHGAADRRPVHTASRPAATLRPTLASAAGTSPRCRRARVSFSKVENVVKAPRTPTAPNARQVGFRCGRDSR